MVRFGFGKKSLDSHATRRLHCCIFFNSSFFILFFSRGVATSFEGKHGSIRFWLKAEMDKPWSFNHKTKKAFTVISPIDINKAEYQVS